MGTLKDPVTLVTALGQEPPEISEAKILAISEKEWREIIPADFQALLELALPQEELNGKSYDSTKLIDIFNCLHAWTRFERRNDGASDDEEYTITANSKTLQKKFGHQYPKYLSFLARYGVIRWIEGRKGADYVTKKKYGTGYCKKVTIQWPYFLSSLAVVKHPGSKYSQERKRKLADLRTMGDQHRFEVLKRVKINTAKIYPVLCYAEENGHLTKTKADSHREALGRILSGSIYYSCDNYGRRHSPYTSLTREYRPELTLDGESLSLVDIRTSQVRLLLVLLKMAIARREGEPGGEGSRPRYVVQVLDKWSKGLRIEDLPGLKSDLALFEQVVAGDIYTAAPQWLLDDGVINRRKFERDGYLDREVCKKRFLKSLFGTHNPKKKPLTRCLVKRFPSLANALKLAKAGENKAQRNLLSHALQSLEAYIVLDQIGDRLQRAGINCVYIHDSALCPVSRFEEVREIFNSTLAEYGLIDAIKPIRTLPELTKDAFSKSVDKTKQERDRGGDSSDGVCCTSFKLMA